MAPIGGRMTMKTRGKDKRSYERLEQQFRVGVTVKPAKPVEGEESQTVFCSTDDVSAGGLKVTFRKPLAVGTVVDLFLVFVHAFRGFEFKGRVVWVRKGSGKKPVCLAGIEFMDVPEPARIALRDAIEERLAELQPPARRATGGKQKAVKAGKRAAPKQAAKPKKSPRPKNATKAKRPPMARKTLRPAKKATPQRPTKPKSPRKKR
jgi:hypothetical protein